MFLQGQLKEISRLDGMQPVTRGPSRNS